MPNGYRLLVVEDDAELCETIADVLRFTGYEVNTALDAESALELLRRAPAPDAIVLDLVLPTMSAADLLAALDGEPTLPAVVLMTGLVQGARGALGARDVLIKPFGADELLSRVARACGVTASDPDTAALSR